MQTTWIYRITHYHNLEHILRYGLLTKSSSGNNPEFVSIGDKSLIQVREEIIVPVEPGDTLAHYVPFYFGLKSPMLYQIFKGYDGVQKMDQREIIYLVSSIGQLQQMELSFVFTDGHARHQLTHFFNNPEDLNQLDWPVINASYWANDENDPDRKRKKQAECLIWGNVPALCIQYILVYDEDMKNHVQKLLDDFKMLDIEVRISKDKAYF